MELIKKFKPYIVDLFLNTIGFAIYIASQQIILLPILAKIADTTVYSNIALYISILNIICYTVGGVLGNVRLIRHSDYEEKNITGDYSRILLISFIIIFIIGLPVCTYIGYSVIASIFLVVTILMSNIRLYAASYYRLDNKFNRVIIQSVLYCIGVTISLIIFYFSKKIYLLLFIPELLCLIDGLKNTDLLKMKLTKTVEMLNTVKTSIKIGIVTFLSNIMGYFDRFVIYPMFDSVSFSVYFAVNSMSNIFNLVSSPISTIILPWVSKVKGENAKNKILKITILANIPVILGVTIIAIPLTYIALRILYSQFLTADNITLLIITTSIVTAIGVAVSLVKSILLKFCSANKLLIAYFTYFAVFLLFAYFLSKKYALIGFTVANIISKSILLLCFIVMLIISKNETIIKDKDNQ